MNRQTISPEEAQTVGAQLNLSWQEFDLEQFRQGMEVELEHGTRDSQTNVTNDDLLTTGKIALAHLKEFPDYYVRLEKLEEEAKAFWSKKA